jgi:HK97 family phage prohead protease
MLKQVFPFEMKEAPDETGVFAGYGATFGNVDLGRDVIAPGAFTESLAKWKAKGKLPKMFWQHNSRQPMGKWTEMKEDSYGLFCRGRLTKGVQVADEAYLLMLDEALDGLSIGYRDRHRRLRRDPERPQADQAGPHGRSRRSASG